jgi:hypothetical protein
VSGAATRVALRIALALLTVAAILRVAQPHRRHTTAPPLASGCGMARAETAAAAAMR